MRKIRIEDSCEPYMYNTECDMKKLKIGDVIDAKVRRRKSKKFFVNNILDYSWYGPYRRIAIIPVDKKDDFDEEDVIVVDETYRWECLMIDLFECNREYYAGWKKQVVSFKKTKEKVDVNFDSLPKLTIRKDVDISRNSMFVHPNCMEKRAIGCYGGIGLEPWEEVEDGIAHNEIELIGYKTPVPEPHTHDFGYNSGHLNVTLRSVFEDEEGEKKEYRIPGYMFEETLGEFRERLSTYVEGAIDIVKDNPNRMSNFYNEFSVTSHYVSVFDDESVDKVLLKYSKEDKIEILNRCMEHLEYEKNM